MAESKKFTMQVDYRIKHSVASRFKVTWEILPLCDIAENVHARNGAYFLCHYENVKPHSCNLVAETYDRVKLTWLQQMLETTAISKLSRNHEESNVLQVDFRARNALVSVIGQLNYHYSTHVFSINDQVFYSINIVERECE